MSSIAIVNSESFVKRSEMGEASKPVIYTLHYLITNSISLALLSDGII
jgi:hypothetical protein